MRPSPQASRVAARWLSGANQRPKPADLTPEFRRFVEDAAKGIRALLERPVDLRVSLDTFVDFKTVTQKDKGPGFVANFVVGRGGEAKLSLYEFAGNMHMWVNERGRNIPVTTPAQVVEAMSGILYDDHLKGGPARAKARLEAVQTIFADLQKALRPWEDTINVYPEATEAGLEVEILRQNPGDSFDGPAIERVVNAVLQKHRGVIEDTDNQLMDTALFLYITIAMDPRAG